MLTSNQNNLNAVRLAAAFLVLYGHGYILLGLPPPAVLSWMTPGPLGVAIFFSISGYLVARSWAHDPNGWRYLARRALRIFPALIACTLLTILVLGTAISTLSLQDYLGHRRTWDYLRNIGLYIVFYLPGVFEANRIPNAVNGSLWSLPVEFLMYLGVAAAGLLLRRRWVYPLLALGCGGASYWWALRSQSPAVVYATDMRQAVIYGTYFWVGASLQAYRCERFFTLSSVFIACLVLYATQSLADWVYPVSWVLVPWVTLGFGLATAPWLLRLTGWGDFSYGVYIYAFPVQQALAALKNDWNVNVYLWWSCVVTMVLAMLSWFWVERPALRFKPGSSHSGGEP